MTEKVGYSVGLEPVEVGEDPDVKAVVQGLLDSQKMPTEKYSQPITSAQEVGWLHKPLVVSNPRFQHRLTQGEATQFAEIYTKKMAGEHVAASGKYLKFGSYTPSVLNHGAGRSNRATCGVDLLCAFSFEPGPVTLRPRASVTLVCVRVAVLVLSRTVEIHGAGAGRRTSVYTLREKINETAARHATPTPTRDGPRHVRLHGHTDARTPRQPQPPPAGPAQPGGEAPEPATRARPTCRARPTTRGATGTRRGATSDSDIATERRTNAPRRPVRLAYHDTHTSYAIGIASAPHPPGPHCHNQHLNFSRDGERPPF